MSEWKRIQEWAGVKADGVPGPATAAAILAKIGVSAAREAHALEDHAAFFAGVRKVTGPLGVAQVETINGLLAAAAHWPIGWVAYALATAWHEAKLRPIHEMGGVNYLFRMYDIGGARPHKARELGNLTAGDGVKYAGRGLVQLTGKTNYGAAGNFLGLDLIGKPDLALDPVNATKILVWGMEGGKFTGQSLADHIGDRGTVASFITARRIINGNDRAALIAGYADKFQQALDAGGW